eukprot:Clim_evm101s157 gene=Clim_evmTU101s157
MTTTRDELRVLQPDGTLGLDEMAKSSARTVLRKGVKLNLLVLGMKGTGRHDLVDTLFHLPGPNCTNSGRKAAADAAIDHEEHVFTFRETDLGFTQRVWLSVAFGLDFRFGDEGVTETEWDYVQKSYTAEVQKLRNEGVYEFGYLRRDTINAILLVFAADGEYTDVEASIKSVKKLFDCAPVIPVITMADKVSPGKLKELKTKISMGLSAAKVYAWRAPNEFGAPVLSREPLAVMTARHVPNNVRNVRGVVVDANSDKNYDFLELRKLLVGSSLVDLLIAGETYLDANSEVADGIMPTELLKIHEKFREEHKKHRELMETKREELRQSISADVRKAIAGLRAREAQILEEAQRLTTDLAQRAKHAPARAASRR